MDEIEKSSVEIEVPTSDADPEGIEAPDNWSYDSDSQIFRLGLPDSNLHLPKKNFDQLLFHQPFGVEWWLEKHSAGSGGLLADEMGLGKTVTALTAIGMLMRARRIDNALVVGPKTVAENWLGEAKTWLEPMVPGVQVHLVRCKSGTTKKDPNPRKLLQRALDPVQKTKSESGPFLIIATYDLVANNQQDFKRTNCKWGCLVLDEAQHVKNTGTKAFKACKNLSKFHAHQTFLMSGTPVMNSLLDLWTLVDHFVAKDHLGSKEYFKKNFVKPIEAGHQNASPKLKEIAKEKRGQLKDLLQEVLLRRTVDETLDLPDKSVDIIWYHLSEKQRESYAAYLEKDAFQEGEGEQFHAFQLIQKLGKICSHPLLEKGHDEKGFKEKLSGYTAEAIAEDSPKFAILLELMKKFRNEGHCTVIASQSTKTLDILEVLLSDFAVKRIDGKVRSAAERLRIAKELESSSTDVLLLSTKAAGVGINVTTANRFIVFDPDWTPANDKQAIGRIHRYGQKRSVKVYYLIAAGTVEERKMQVQMHKDRLHDTVFAKKPKYLHEKNKEFFQLSPAGQCQSYEDLKDKQLAWSTEEQTELLRHRSIHGITRYLSVRPKATDNPMLADTSTLSTVQSPPPLGTGGGGGTAEAMAAAAPIPNNNKDGDTTNVEERPQKTEQNVGGLKRPAEDSALVTELAKQRQCRHSNDHEDISGTTNNSIDKTSHANEITTGIAPTAGPVCSLKSESSSSPAPPGVDDPTSNKIDAIGKDLDKIHEILTKRVNCLPKGSSCSDDKLCQEIRVKMNCFQNKMFDLICADDGTTSITIDKKRDRFEKLLANCLGSLPDGSSENDLCQKIRDQMEVLEREMLRRY